MKLQIYTYSVHGYWLLHFILVKSLVSRYELKTFTSYLLAKIDCDSLEWESSNANI